MGIPHVLAIPYPAQGHVIPLMEISQCLANNGIKVTFVNTDFNHDRIVKALSHAREINELIHLVSIPDGLEPCEDRNDLGKLSVALAKVVPEKLEALVEGINGGSGSDKIVCVVADYAMGLALELADKMGIKKVSFLPTAVGLLALMNNALKLVDQGIVDKDGIPLNQEAVIRLSPDMPAITAQDFVWTRIGNSATQKLMFHSALENINHASTLADWTICNSLYEIEPGALALVPDCMPIGPLLATNRLANSAGYFWPEDSSSLSWLDQQPPDSTIYVAFGSYTVFDQAHFHQLALGLELTGRPFLWVVRQDMTRDNDKAYPEGFLERVKNSAKMVGWAPQQKVLSHPSIACFMSHCGWNSTVEGVSNGVPFLCWPYFADQFLNRSYICEYWKIGLELEEDENGIVTKEEIRSKVELLLNDESYKNRALNLQSSAAKGGSSSKNFNNFVDWIKEN